MPESNTVQNLMLTVPPFDAQAAQYVLQLMSRMTVPAHEVQVFFTLRLSLEQYIKEAGDGAD